MSHDLMQVVDFTGLAQVCYKASSSKVGSIKLNQVCRPSGSMRVDIRRLIVETNCTKLVNKESCKSTSIKPDQNLQQTCYH